MSNTTTEHRTAPDHSEKGWPGGIPYIIGNEGCERFSYYGMRAILYIYVVGLYINLRGLDEAAATIEATQTTHLFNAAVYALPLIGAIISDRLLGKYRTILSLSIVYCLGHLALAVFESPTMQLSIFGTVLVDPIQGLMIGLGLIALGSGGIKPCVSAHVGDQFGRGNWHLLQKVYNIFYFIINFGSAFATLFIPLIRGKLIIDPVTGYYYYDGSVSLAFGVPGILMGLATIFFWMGRHKFIHVQPSHPGKAGLMDVIAGSALFMVIGFPIFFHDMLGPVGTLVGSAAALGTFVVVFGIRQKIEEDDGFLALTFFSIRAKILGQNGEGGSAPGEGQQDLRGHWLYGPAAARYGSETAEGPIAVWRIISIFTLVSCFWALFDQHSSTWIAQAKEMDRVLDLTQTGWIGFGAILGAMIAGAFWLSLKEHPKQLPVSALVFALGVLFGYIASVFGPYDIQPSQVPALNPFMVMILIPYTTFGLYPLLDKLGFEPTPLRRMTLGMFTASVAFVTVALLQHAMEAEVALGSKIHVVWQLVPYFVITLAEVMVSITGLEFGYSQAPKRMKSVIMGFWLFTVTLGNLLVAFLAGFKGLEPAQFFWVFAGLMAVAGVLFGVRAKFYTYRDYSQ